jgi:hypothetical protein
MLSIDDGCPSLPARYDFAHSVLTRSEGKRLRVEGVVVLDRGEPLAQRVIFGRCGGRAATWDRNLVAGACFNLAFSSASCRSKVKISNVVGAWKDRNGLPGHVLSYVQ